MARKRVAVRVTIKEFITGVVGSLRIVGPRPNMKREDKTTPLRSATSTGISFFFETRIGVRPAIHDCL
jgi:hypothetical protein